MGTDDPSKLGLAEKSDDDCLASRFHFVAALYERRFVTHRRSQTAATECVHKYLAYSTNNEFI